MCTAGFPDAGNSSEHTLGTRVEGMVTENTIHDLKAPKANQDLLPLLLGGMGEEKSFTH